MKTKGSVFALTASVVVTLATTGLLAQGPADHHHHGGLVTKAIAILHGTKGNEKVQGTITFSRQEKGVHVQGTVQGLTPGKHGFHVHQFGDLSSPDAKSAGDHFNPDMEKHAGPDDRMRHVGDLGNLEADAQGNANYDRVNSHIQLNGPHSILGRGLIVHEKADDFVTQQPPGNAGARIAGGVIGVAQGGEEKGDIHEGEHHKGDHKGDHPKKGDHLKKGDHPKKGEHKAEAGGPNTEAVKAEPKK